MLRTDLLLGDFETVATVYKWDTAELLRMSGGSGGTGLVYVPAQEERARHEIEMLTLLRHAGVPECRQTIESGAGTIALQFDGAEDARPLALVHDLPESTLRAGLTALLQTINFAHSRGIVHRRIDRSVVLADASGRFWLMGWADAKPVSNAPATSVVLSEVAADLRDLARAFREALLRRPWPDPEGARIHERGPRTAAGQELIDAGVKVDRDFARVLSRLVTADPRDAYTGATDVLADLSAVDATAFDPWESIRPIGTRREVARVLRLLDNTRLATSETVMHAASVDYVAPYGAGKSRMLSEIARVARSRNVIVLTSEGGARGSWGGVGALAHQLVQLLGRGARMCLQHETALRHLLGEHDAEPRREPPPQGLLLGEGRDPLISSCTAAVTDLVRTAFRETPGLLILDDEDNLSPAARQVWRSTGEFVQAVNGGGGVLRALLVAGSTRSYPAEVGAYRVTVELKPWRQRDLEKFLARAFAAPGGARDASAAVIRITGGRPGDVLGYLRELERRGTLRREGLRWRLAAPLSGLPPFAGGVAEQVRRTLGACGRDAAALVECLAVARDVRLSRSSVGELCDVRGPRLASAADSAVAAGLLVVDGTGWRIRTDAIAHKVYAAVPDDRRKVLHREILNVLLETSPDSIDPIAAHARASYDPRAEAWTREAIARAQAEGAWMRALAHLDDAASLLGNGFSGLEAELHRAELLSSLGRVGEVIDSLRQRTQSEYPSLEVGLKGLLLLTRAYYEARDWHGLLELATPDTCEVPMIVAEIRFIRAAAMRHLGRIEMAAREARLASAEVAGTATPSVMLARYEYEYQACFYTFDWPGTRSALVSKLRIGARMKDKRQVILDLAKLGNAARYVARNMRLSHAILVRAVGVSRTARDVGGAPLSGLYANLAYTCGQLNAYERAYRHFGRANHHAVQSGAASLVVVTRIRLIACGIASGVVAYEDKHYLQVCMSNVSAMSESAMLSVCIDLGRCLLYLSQQDALERLLDRVSSFIEHDRRHAALRAHVTVGRMWLDESPIDVAAPSSAAPSPRGLTKTLLATKFDGCWINAIAYSALRPEFDDDHWLRRFVARGGAMRLTTRHTDPRWGPISIALALGLWIPIEYSATVWHDLLGIVRRHKGPLPVALEWQRVLMESREYRRLGEWHKSQAARDNAEAQLDLFLREEYGERGSRAHARWKVRLNSPPAPATGVLPLQQSRPQDVTAAVTGETRTATIARCESPTSWRDALQSIVATNGTKRVVLSSTHLRELHLFCDMLRDSAEGREVVWKDAGAGPRPRLDRRRILVLVAPNLWPVERVIEAREVLANDATRPDRIVTLLTVPLNTFRDAGPCQRSLSEITDGRIEQLEPLCGVPDRRAKTFLSLVARKNAAVTVDRAVVDEIARYEWPGGLAEIERLVEELVGTNDSPITVETLNDTGWRLRVDASDDGLLQEEREVLREVVSCPSAGISELSRAVGRPRRTVLRYLNRLVQSGSVVRTGRGRATLYRARTAGAHYRT